MAKPILVTLTAPTASGKSFLFEYIRDEAKLPCLISTTTRKPRPGEKEGIDYYFIDESVSSMLEATEQFAELAVYRGVRYGVTKKEFESKLSTGLAFLIVEPSGIDSYVKPAIDMGAHNLKYYISTDLETRIERFKSRVTDDLMSQIGKFAIKFHEIREDMQVLIKDSSNIAYNMQSHLDRLVAMLTEERKWYNMHQWDRVLDGTATPEKNLSIIMNDIASTKERLKEIEQWKINKGLK